MNQRRPVRVFISSTFRDMHGEREELVKQVFPELRKLCRSRGVEFVEVDLRWGVTEEQSKRGDALPICLEEIHHCRPYFICLLGERYGWSEWAENLAPDRYKELVGIHSWLEEHKGKSVTELEILHGVLNNPEMKNHAFFYFRDAEESRRIEAELARNPSHQAEPESSKTKVAEIKKVIRDSRFPVKDYVDAKKVGELVLEDLRRVIDKEYPESAIPSALERERFEHEAYAESRRRTYIGRQEYFAILDTHVENAAPSAKNLPLVVLGESGSGKSALIANWLHRYSEGHPEDFVVAHFTGGTPDSADHIKLLRRIMQEIKERYEPSKKKDDESAKLMSALDKEGDIPTDPEKVVEAFPLWLGKTLAKGRFILILDALNQVEDKGNALDLGWLPGYFPPNIRVIVSTLPGRCLEALKKRNCPTMEVGALTVEERKKLIVDYLYGRYRKNLTVDQAERVAAAPQSANPLFLRTLLEELRVFGKHEELNQRIEHYLSVTEVDDLFELALERMEQDYERDRPGLVKEAVSLIWASRKGLSEAEIIEILKIPRSTWSPLYLALEESLIDKSGLLSFGHDFLRKAVEDRYLSDKEERRTAHLSLANYFEPNEFDERKADELPWQLHRAENWERLKNCVSDIEMFLRFSEEDKKYELTGYWLALRGQYDMAAAYTEVIVKCDRAKTPMDDLSFLLFKIAGFLLLNARFAAAEPLYLRALEIHEKTFGCESQGTLLTLNELGVLYKRQNDYTRAEPLYLRALEIREKTLGDESPSILPFLNNLAELYERQNAYAKAEPLYLRALKICESTMSLEHPFAVVLLNNLGLLCESQCHYAQAELFFLHALEVGKKTMGHYHPINATILNNLATLNYRQNRCADVEPLYLRALEILEKVFGDEHPNTANTLNNLAKLYERQNDYARAEPLYLRVLEICEKTLGGENPGNAMILCNLAELYERQNAYAKAEPLYLRALEIYEKTFGCESPKVILILNNLALVYASQNHYAQAEPLYLRALEICEKGVIVKCGVWRHDQAAFL